MQRRITILLSAGLGGRAAGTIIPQCLPPDNPPPAAGDFLLHFPFRCDIISAFYI